MTTVRVRILAWAVALAALGPVHAAEAETLGLSEAMTLAKERQPLLRQARSVSDAARARADQARAPLLPQVVANAGYQRSTANFVDRPGSVPRDLSTTTAPNTLQTYNFFTTGVTLTQLIWDFGKSWNRWEASKLTAASQEDTERATLQQTVFTVRQAFFNARASRALVAVAQESLASQQRHLEQIQGFVEVGTRPAIDLAQARTDLANAKVQNINAQNGYETAKAVLNQAIGLERDTAYEVADESLAPLASEDKALESLVEEAVSTRPEYAALTTQIRAQELTQSSIRGAYWPSLGFSTGLTDNGRQIENLSWNWSGGLNLTWNLFEGGLTRAQSREAAANLETLKAQQDGLRQRVRLEIAQAQLSVKAAKASLEAAGEALAAARERLRLSEGRYQTGVGNALELGDAQVALTSAAAQRVQSEFTLATARAQLLVALGTE
jgi:outer membrane protein